VIPEDCPYNISKMAPFQTATGMTGYEATLKLYSRKIGTVILVPENLPHLQGLSNLDAVNLRLYSESLGWAAPIMVSELVVLFHAHKVRASQEKNRAKLEGKERRKLTRFLETKDCAFRLKGWEPGRWDFMGCKDLNVVRAILERAHPGQLEALVNRDTLPEFTLPQGSF